MNCGNDSRQYQLLVHSPQPMSTYKPYIWSNLKPCLFCTSMQKYCMQKLVSLFTNCKGEIVSRVQRNHINELFLNCYVTFFEFVMRSFADIPLLCIRTLIARRRKSIFCYVCQLLRRHVLPCDHYLTSQFWFICNYLALCHSEACVLFCIQM